MTTASHIIEKFGGVRPTAAALNVAPTTVQYWKDVGVIPARRQPDVLKAARAKGLDIGPADFFPAAAE